MQCCIKIAKVSQLINSIWHKRSSTETQDRAEELLQAAKEAVIDALDYENEDCVAGVVQPE